MNVGKAATTLPQSMGKSSVQLQCSDTVLEEEGWSRLRAPQNSFRDKFFYCRIQSAAVNLCLLTSQVNQGEVRS